MPKKTEIMVNGLPLNPPIFAGFCDSFLSRLRGYMFKKKINYDEGLILAQNKDSRIDSSIHMLAVNFDLTIVWINSDMHVVDLIIAHPWRLAYFPSKPARYILEIHPERSKQISIGDVIAFNEI